MLMEILIAIFFFSLVLASSMSVFGKAYEMSEKAGSGSAAMTETNSAAEIIRSCDTEEEINTLLKSRGFNSPSADRYEKFFNNGQGLINIEISMEDRLLTAEMSCYHVDDNSTRDPGEAFYSLTIKHAMRGGYGLEK